MGDETSYPPHQEHQTNQDPGLPGGEDPSAGVDAFDGYAPGAGGGKLDFAEPAEPVPLLRDPEPLPGLEILPAVEIRAAEPAPLVAIPSNGTAGDGAVGDSARELLGLPLQFLNQLLQRLGSAKLDSLADLMPAARLVAIALLAGVALKLTGATLGAINDIPLLGGLLELTGLVSMLNFLARNALKQKKRAELLSRIRKLRQDFLG